jgi:hypothetical protein
LFLGTSAENLSDMDRKGRRVNHTASPQTRNANHWKAYLSVEQIAAIRSRASEPRKKLAVEFGTSPPYISAIICGRKRKYA